MCYTTWMGQSTLRALMTAQPQPLCPEDLAEQQEILAHFDNGASWSTAMGLSCVEPANVTRWLQLARTQGPDSARCGQWLTMCRRAFSAHLENEYAGMREIYRLRALCHANKAQASWLAELDELRGK